MPKKRPRIRVFSPRSGASAACLKGRVRFFGDFSCFKLQFHFKSDRLLVNLGRAFGQCTEKGASVRFAEDSAVEDDDCAGVGLRTDETPDSLAEFEDGLRKRILFEGAASLRFDAFEPGFGDRMVGVDELEPGDDNARKR